MTSRTLPYNLEAERSILGALLIQPARWTEVCDELTSGDFYRGGHGRIFAALAALHERGIAPDLVTLKDTLGRRGDLEEAGGPTYLAGLVDGVPRGSNIRHYVEIVREDRMRRELARLCDDMARRAAAGEDAPEDIAHDAEAALLALTTQAGHADGLKLVSDHLPAYCERFTALVDGKRTPGTPTGLRNLDMLTCGLRPGLTLLAGRTSAGKTTVAAQFAHHVAATTGPVAFFSLEMDGYQTTTRLVAHVGRIDGARLQAGRLLPDEYPSFNRALGRLEDVPLYLDVEAERTIRDVRAAARRLKAARGLALVVVDYLQLLRTPASERPRTREEEVAKISRGLKALSKELDVPVLALAQLSREADRADQGEPRLSHLRESGALEQDADVVLLLWRPSLHDSSVARDLVCLKVAKNRQGPTGQVDLRFHESQFRFTDLGDDPPPSDLFGDGQRVAGG